MKKNLIFAIIIFQISQFCTRNSPKMDQFWVQKRPYLKKYKLENKFFIRFSTFRIFHVYITIFDFFIVEKHYIFFKFEIKKHL